MSLANTLIFPVNPGENELDIFNEMIRRRKHMVFFVIGKDDWAKKLVSISDAVAGKKPARQIAWVHDLRPYADLMKPFFLGTGLILDEIREPSFGFSLSLKLMICDLLRKSDPEANAFRVNHAFLMAEV
jgi:hypothetical protein